MIFNWLNFLNQQNIEYATSGANVGRNNVVVHCPFCGSGDPSKHLGINLETGAWGCLRNSQHRGRAPKRLVMGLLGITSAQADAYVENRQFKGQGELKDVRARLDQKEEIKQVSGKGIEFLDSFSEIDNRESKKRFINYLVSRGFDQPNILVRNYGLMCCLTGEWKDRIIFPVWQVANKKLVGWTGRTIGYNQAIRYRAHPAGSEIKQHVFNGSKCGEGNILVITEGPIDALKIDFYGRVMGVHSVATMGTQVTDAQCWILGHLAIGYDQVLILFDDGALGQALQLKDRLDVECGIQPMPRGIDDPGDFIPDQAREFCLNLLNKYL